MNTFLLFLLFTAISFFDYKMLIEEKRTKELIIYTTILGLAFVLFELHILGFKVPGLSQMVTTIVRLIVP